MVYLNYAALCPTRPEVDEEVARTQQAFSQYLYSEEGLAWYLQKVSACREAVARFLNYQDRDAVAFVPNASTANYLTLSFIPWKPGDGIITTTHENPSILREIKALANHGAEIHVIQPQSPNYLVKTIDDLTKSHPIRSIIVSHVSHVDGRIFPIAEVAEIASREQILFIVDGAQAVGHIPVDLSTFPFDCYFFTGHKWCQGPLGTGAIILTQQFTERVPAFAEEARRSGNPPAQRFEMGTHNISLIAGLAHGCELLTREGLREEEKRVVRETAEERLNKLKGIQIKEWTGPHAPGILSFASQDSIALHKILHDQCRIVTKLFADYPPGEHPLIRLSWLGKGNQEHAERAVRQLAQAVGQPN